MFGVKKISFDKNKKNKLYQIKKKTRRASVVTFIMYGHGQNILKLNNLKVFGGKKTNTPKKDRLRSHKPEREEHQF